MLSTIYKCRCIKSSNQRAKILSLRKNLAPNFLMTFFSHIHTTTTIVSSQNYNCTICLFQLQFPFYNCRKLAQLPVKICPWPNIQLYTVELYRLNRLVLSSVSTLPPTMYSCMCMRGQQD